MECLYKSIIIKNNRNDPVYETTVKARLQQKCTQN